jgi:uncharacterized protein (DUF2267 family)
MSTIEKEMREARHRSSSNKIGIAGSIEVDAVAAFFGAIEQSGALPSGVSAKQAGAAVLRTLARRLSAGEVRAVQSSIVPELAALFQRPATHTEEPGETFGRKEFIDYVAQELHAREDEAEPIARRVLLALRAELPPQKIHDIESQLPKDLVNLWHTKEARERVRASLGSAGGG